MNLPRTFQLSTLAYVLCCASATSHAQQTIELGVFTQFRTTIDTNFKSGAPLVKIDITQKDSWAQVLGSQAYVWAGLLDLDLSHVPRPENVSFYRAFIQTGIQSSPALNGEITYKSMKDIVLERRATGGWNLQTSQNIPTFLKYSFSGPVAAGTQIEVKTATTALVTRHDGTNSFVDPSSMGISSKIQLIGDYLVNYRMDRAYDRVLGWLDNWSADISNPLSAIKRVIRTHLEDKSKHTQPAEKSLYYKTPSGSNGIRGSIDVKGIAVHTASPGVVAYNVTLPDSLTIDVPLAFTKNNVGAVLDIAFDGHLLGSFQGDGYLTDELNVLEVDISSFAGKTGLMTLTVNTSGPGSAEVFVAEQFSGLGFATSVVSSVPEPGSQALWIAGLLTTVGLCRRRQRSLLP